MFKGRVGIYRATFLKITAADDKIAFILPSPFASCLAPPQKNTLVLLEVPGIICDLVTTLQAEQWGPVNK